MHALNEHDTLREHRAASRAWLLGIDRVNRSQPPREYLASGVPRAGAPRRSALARRFSGDTVLASTIATSHASEPHNQGRHSVDGVARVTQRKAGRGAQEQQDARSNPSPAIVAPSQGRTGTPRRPRGQWIPRRSASLAPVAGTAAYGQRRAVASVTQLVHERTLPRSLDCECAWMDAHPLLASMSSSGARPSGGSAKRRGW